MSYNHPPNPSPPSPSTTAITNMTNSALHTPITGNPINSPPSVRRRNRFIPLPSQTMEEVVIHPTLQYRHHRTLEGCRLDLIGTMLHSRSGHLVSAHLRDWATQPRLPSLSIVHPQLPWAITVHPYRLDSYVTVQDVIRSIAESLATPTRDGGSGRRIDYLGSDRQFVGLVRSDAGGDIWEICLL
ncbi:hypothetical protein L218DRAFT_1004556 [Marasmius fiardii PR-910]|nr:hypothetical protein L218DRAFT_1004556 [Marasmius fiardii PR-910]